MTSYNSQPVRAFPIQSSYAQSYQSPEKSLARRTETNFQQAIAANRSNARYNDEPQSYRPSSATSSRWNDQNRSHEVADADDYTTRYETTRSGRAVPVLQGLNQVQQGYTTKGISRPTPVGPTVVPASSYRAPSGTTLNKVPHSARERLNLQQQQRETQERLRAKALDRKLRDAVITQELQARTASARPRSAGIRPKSATAKKQTRDDRRHQEQQRRQEQAYVSQDEIALLARPYESQRQQPGLRPSSSAQLGSNQKWGPASEPADRPGRLVSSSSQSRLTPAQLADQPVAGKASNAGAGNDLAKILGGGHEHVVFGQSKNAPSAQTRQQIPTAWSPPPASSYQQDPAAKGPAYAPFATHTSVDPKSIPERFNDQAGAVMVRDDLTREIRHASASVGYGKSHAGYRDYIARPAAASGLAKAAAGGEEKEARQNPFMPSSNNSILTWTTDGINRSQGGKDQQLQKLKQTLWSKTSGDIGGMRPEEDPTLKQPVAGVTKPSEGPLQLYYPTEDDLKNFKTYQTTQKQYGASSPVKGVNGAQPKVNGSPEKKLVKAYASSGNPLNPYTPEELAVLTKRPQQLAPSALGYGKKHPAFKTFVLGAVAPGQQAQL